MIERIVTKLCTMVCAIASKGCKKVSLHRVYLRNGNDVFIKLDFHSVHVIEKNQEKLNYEQRNKSQALHADHNPVTVEYKSSLNLEAFVLDHWNAVWAWKLLYKSSQRYRMPSTGNFTWMINHTHKFKRDVTGHPYPNCIAEVVV